MKQKTIKIKIETPQVTEVEIALPFYGKNDMKKPTEYIKVDEKENAIKISKHYSGNGWYAMNRGKIQWFYRPAIADFYPIEKQEFDMAFAEFVESISNI